MRRLGARSICVSLVVTGLGCAYPEFGFEPAATDGAAGADATVGDSTALEDAVIDTEAPPLDTAASALDTAEGDTTVSADDASADARDARAPDSTAPVDAAPDSADSATDARDAADTADAAPTYVYFIGFGSTWKYRDDNNVPGSSWTGINPYDDTNWKSGPAPLGYGNGNEATVVGYGGDAGAKYTTTWFRKSFNVSDPTKYDQLRVRMRRDDGAVVWLNGVEIVRTNMPAGTINATTNAVTAVNDESVIFTFNPSSSALKVGTNVIAVEVHQVSEVSSDIHFDLELTARNAP